MCLTVDKGFKSKLGARIASWSPLVAEEDINVYKRLKKIGVRFESPDRGGFDYEKGVLYTTPWWKSNFTFRIREEYNSIVIEVNRGYHCYSSRQRAIERCFDREVVVQMVIPKGSKYFVGRNNELVSNQLYFKDHESTQAGKEVQGVAVSAEGVK